MRGTCARLVAAIGVGAVVSVAGPAREAEAQRRIACGEFYEVRPGDTLREIAVDAYDVGNYQIIFDANRDILSTPSLLLVGQRLFIPCLDGSGPATRQEAEAAIVQGQQAALQAPETTPEQFALPDPVPQPTEEELFGEEEAAEAEAEVEAAAADEGAAVYGDTAAAPEGTADPAPEEAAEAAPPARKQRRRRRVVRSEIIPQPGGGRVPVTTMVGVQPLQPGAPEPGRRTDRGDRGETREARPGAASGGGARSARATGGAAAAAGIQPAPGQSGTGGAAALAGIQPAPGAQAGGSGRSGRSGGGAAAAAGLQPAPGAHGGSASGAALAGIQPEPGARGGSVEAPAAGIQPAPGARGASAESSASDGRAGASPARAGIQPAPGATGRSGGAAALAGIQPAPGSPGGASASGEAAEPARAAPSATNPLDRLAAEGEEPAAASAPDPDPARSVSVGRAEPSVARRLLPPSAPRPAQTRVPDQPVPRLSFDSGVTLQGDAPQPDQPARMPEDGADGEAELAAVTPDGPAEQAAGASVIRILTGPYPPYTGRDLPEQGMLTEVVSRALDHAAPERERRIAFVGDWSAHLDVLLPDGAFDIGFPWFKPDCSRMELLGEEMRRRCTDYNWSQPLHELVVGYFVRAGSGIEGATDYDDLLGLTFCRPEGYYGFDLEQKGLSAPRIALLTPATPADCLRALADGEADVVSLSVTLVEAEIAELGLAGRIAELPELADILTLHALAPKSNPSGRAYLTLVNRGLREMRESGEWFRVVARHLAAAQ